MAKRLLMGNEAFAHAALEAGVNVVAGYPGTPSSEVIETVARLHKTGKAEGVYVEWSCNEKAALEVAAAASMSGARALFTCKQVGLNVASDALMSLNYVGVRGGLVLFVADDPGPISSQTEQDTRRFAAFAKVPVLDPATPEQGFLMMKEAFELSERYKTPVIVRPTTRIDHASTFFEVQPRTVARPLPEGGFERDPSEWVIFPKRSYRAHGEINQRLGSIAYDFTYDPDLNRFNNGFDKLSGMPARALPDLSTELGANAERVEIYGADYAGERPKLGIVCGGVSRQYALEAIELIEREAEAAGANVPSYRFLQIGTPYPFPSRIARRFLKDLSDVLVLEELDSVIEEELLKVSGASFLSPNIHGKLTKEANDRGENSTEDAAYRIAAFFDRYSKSSIQAMRPDGGIQSIQLVQLVEQVLGPKALISYSGNLPMRAPVLCAGCPHRGAFYAMKRAVKKLKIAREDAVFCGDIGCYTLGNAMPLDACDTCLCMGAGITMSQGFSVTNPFKKSIAFIGDSTFFASGMTGVANAVYNQHDITICILDNSTTAMTGSQPHPGTGATLMGSQSEPIDIAGVLRSLGVRSITEVDPLDEAAAESACIESLLEEVPTAIIFKSPCVWLQPFGSPAKVHVNACTGCKKCITEIGCPAIGFDPQAKGVKSKDRGQALIDESQCNGCGLCLQVCPFKAIEILTPEEKALFESARRATVAGSDVPGSVNLGSAGKNTGEDSASVREDASADGSVGSDTSTEAVAAYGVDVDEGSQRTHIGSDETDLEDSEEPQERAQQRMDDLARSARSMLEIEDAFELDSGGLNLAEMYGTGSLEKIAAADAPQVSRGTTDGRSHATEGELFADSFTDATIDVQIPSSGYRRFDESDEAGEGDLSEDVIRVGTGVARPVNRNRSEQDLRGANEAGRRPDPEDPDRQSRQERPARSRTRRFSRRIVEEEVSNVERVKFDELGDNFDGLVGNLVDSLTGDSFDEYSTAAAAYGAARDAVINNRNSSLVGQDIDSSKLEAGTNESAASDESPKHYYMKNTSYRRKAITNVTGQTGQTMPVDLDGTVVAGSATPIAPRYTDAGYRRDAHLTGEIDLTRDHEEDGSDQSSREEDNGALDVLDALNSSVYIEVDDGEETWLAAQAEKAQRRAAREAAEAARKEAQEAMKREAQKAARDAAREAERKAALEAERSALEAEREARKAEREIDRKQEKEARAKAPVATQEEPIKPSAVMTREEREKLRAQYAQYVHYSPTQYGASNSSGASGNDDPTKERETSGSDKPSVKQSRWGGRG